MPSRMKRNCNLELRLLPSSAASLSPAEYSGRHQHHNIMDQESSASPLINHQHQQLTIFYNGRVCVCDVTEFQARNIILLASREMEDRARIPTGSEPASPSLQSPQLYGPGNSSGLSMKRSLQRFLQKRKHRSLAASPYH